MPDTIEQYKRSLLEAGLSGERGGISQIKQSPLEQMVGRVGSSMSGMGDTLHGKLESKGNPILSALGQAMISEPFQIAGAALQDWSGTTREYSEEQPYNRAPITGGDTLQTMKFDPRMVEVAGFAQPFASLAGRAGKAVSKMGVKGSEKAGDLINQGHDISQRAQPRSGNYATEQQGAFYRVRPTSASAGSGRGFKEQEWGGGATGVDTGGAGRGGYGVPPVQKMAKGGLVDEPQLDAQRMSLLDAALAGADRSGGIQVSPSMSERAKAAIARNMKAISDSEWAQGVRQRGAHPLETLAAEARRWRDMPATEALGQFGGSGLAGVVKGRGGNWIEQNLPDHIDRAVGISDISRRQTEQALAKWIKGPMQRYIKQEMGTPEDPIRKLAEHGIIHRETPPLAAFNKSEVIARRQAAGYPQEGIGVSEAAKRWEDVADEMITGGKAGNFMQGAQRPIEGKEWIDKLPKDTMLYDMPPLLNAPNAIGRLGMYRIKDVLRQDMDEGLLRPENLNAVTIEEAVKRAHARNVQQDIESKRIMDEGFAGNLTYPAIKEYPSGHRWVTLPDAGKPEGLRKIQEIGCAGGWCTQNEKEALEYGLHDSGNKLHLLIDKEGRPHVQVHTSEQWAGPEDLGITNLTEMKPLENAWYSARVENMTMKHPKYRQEIVPMMQDFIRSGNYGDVNDIHHADLYRPYNIFNPDELETLKFEGHPINPSAMTLDEIRAAREALSNAGKKAISGSSGSDTNLDFLNDVVPPQTMARGGHVKFSASKELNPSIDMMKLITMPHKLTKAR